MNDLRYFRLQKGNNDNYIIIIIYYVYRMDLYVDLGDFPYVTQHYIIIIVYMHVCVWMHTQGGLY